ncbi:MAG: hypothetical protein QHH10_06790 [Peptococcaceae bacterium]|jgi:hypothetical protein|nr:hypothetical protein [Peptococcaceae bacterium]MDH7525006.1 hypothetical protein [Peptococcaceae bacterium]
MRQLAGFTLPAVNLRGKWWKLLAACFLAALLVYGINELTAPPPKEAVLQGLVKTLNAKSYRYRAVAVRVLEGKESIISEINGEKNLRGVHLQGSLPIIKAEVEIYHLGDVLYRRDSLTKGWVVVPDKERAAVEKLIAEINPLGAFHFTERDNIDVKYVGREKAGGKTCRLYEVMGRGGNKYMELYWEDFNYRLWIDRKEGVIRRAEIMAEHRDNSRHLLKIDVELKDFNEPVDIKGPEV